MKYAVATVVFLVSCGSPPMHPPQLRDRCSGGGAAACQALDERCRAGELDSCRQGIAAVEKTDAVRASRLAWYWCARATLDNTKNEIVSGCSALARVHDEAIGTRHDAAAAAELYARVCNVGDDADPCTNAARLTLEAHPGDRAGFQRLLARAFEINAWGSVDDVSRQYLAVGDTESAVDVLRRTCHGGRKQSCDQLRTMGRLTQNDVRMYEERTSARSRASEADEPVTTANKDVPPSECQPGWTAWTVVYGGVPVNLARRWFLEKESRAFLTDDGIKSRTYCVATQLQWQAENTRGTYIWGLRFMTTASGHRPGDERSATQVFRMKPMNAECNHLEPGKPQVCGSFGLSRFIAGGSDQVFLDATPFQIEYSEGWEKPWIPIQTQTIPPL